MRFDTAVWLGGALMLGGVAADISVTKTICATTTTTCNIGPGKCSPQTFSTSRTISHTKTVRSTTTPTVTVTDGSATDTFTMTETEVSTTVTTSTVTFTDTTVVTNVVDTLNGSAVLSSKIKRGGWGGGRGGSGGYRGGGGSSWGGRGGGAYHRPGGAWGGMSWGGRGGNGGNGGWRGWGGGNGAGNGGSWGGGNGGGSGGSGGIGSGWLQWLAWLLGGGSGGGGGGIGPGKQIVYCTQLVGVGVIATRTITAPATTTTVVPAEETVTTTTTVISTSTDTVAGPTLYPQCKDNNQAVTVNGKSIVGVTNANGSLSDSRVVVGVGSAEDCCVDCITDPVCGSYAFAPNGYCSLFFPMPLGTQCPAGGNAFDLTVQILTNPQFYTVGNGKCGAYTVSEDEDSSTNGGGDDDD